MGGGLTSRLRRGWNERFIAFFPALIVALIGSFCHARFAKKIDASRFVRPSKKRRLR